MSARQFKENDKIIIDCILLPMSKRLDYELELRNTKIQMEQAYLEKEAALTKLRDIYQEIENKQQELLKVNEKLINLSNTDQLTGIPNRRLFEMKLKEQIVRYSTDGKIKFIVILPYLQEKEMLKTAQKINQSIEKINWVKVDSVTVSVGISTFEKGDTRDSIIERADLALYKAKKNGRNQVVNFSN